MTRHNFQNKMLGEIVKHNLICWKLLIGITCKVILTDLSGKVSELKYFNAIYLIAKMERKRENFARCKVISSSIGVHFKYIMQI